MASCHQTFKKNIRQYEKILSEYSLQMYFLHKNEYLYANLSEYFEANMKRMMRLNGVCEYTETCEYEATKINIRLDSLRSE